MIRDRPLSALPEARYPRNQHIQGGAPHHLHLWSAAHQRNQRNETLHSDLMETEKAKHQQTPVAYHTEPRQTCSPFELGIVLHSAVHVAT